MKNFTVTETHLLLLQRMQVGWCGDEFGAPEINPKRPYGNSSVLTDMVEKARDGTAGDMFGFKLDVVELGTDEDGDIMITCIVMPADSLTRKKRRKQLSGAATVALKALNEAMLDDGEHLPETSTIPGGVLGVTIDRWRRQFQIRYGDRETSTVRQAFNRARTTLLKEDRVMISDPYVWVLE